MSISHFDTSMKNRSRPEFNTHFRLPRRRAPHDDIRTQQLFLPPAAECLTEQQLT
jgi:hypothetical protein